MSKKKKIILLVSLLIIVVAVILLYVVKNNNQKIRNGSITEIYYELPSEYYIERIPKDSLSYKILEKTYIEVKEEDYSTETGNVEILVTAPDLMQLMNQGMKILDEIKELPYSKQKEKIEQNIIDILNTDTYPKKETAVEVKIKKQRDGTWKIEHNDDFAKAISGDISFLLMDSVRNMIGE